MPARKTTPSGTTRKQPAAPKAVQTKVIADTLYSPSSEKMLAKTCATQSATRKKNAYAYDVCFSFAGENRTYVERVVRYLKDKNVRVFYDTDEQANLWGKDLIEHLDNLYQNQARFCVMFVSEAYARKLWTVHERKSAQARAFANTEEYILPARFDDTQLPGIRSTVGYIDLRQTTPAALGKLIIEKLRLRLPGDERFAGLKPSQIRPARPLSSATTAPTYPRGRVSSSGAWVLLDDEVYLSQRVEGAIPDTIEVQIVPKDAREEARLRSLDRGQYSLHTRIGYAHGNDGGFVLVQSVKVVSELGKTKCLLLLKPEQTTATGLVGAYNGLSAEDIAERRARLLLLDEKLAKSANMSDTFLAGIITGTDRDTKITEGIFPALWKRHQSSSINFLRWARLHAVFRLKSADIVEHVLDLTLGPITKGVLPVQFEGQPKNQGYRVQPGEAIKFTGTCSLD